ncbi:cryptochrome/photolyase family protein [Pelagibacterium montanilacus]|uniref:cryptochrome/photolyase family protein n=1 Tax=Pelagibacterium montanilacus TaxID=2185280 RepID=UPI000F8ECFF9|nr:deoxyribodipyrimidine photo-lyase [Pelagibacterium montanilacus]
MAKTALVWFRNDLRIEDNPALNAALEHGEATRALYIVETGGDGRERGAASKAWLTESLRALAVSLARRGVTLDLAHGPAKDTLADYVRTNSVDFVFWNRRYDHAGRSIDTQIKADQTSLGVTVRSFNASLLVEPWDITTKAGGPFSVFTPFWKALREKEIPRPARVATGSPRIEAPTLDLPAHPAWAKKVLSHWEIGEKSAAEQLETFIAERMAGYPDGRDVPGRDTTSTLSPYLAFGEISPRQIWHAVRHAADQNPSLASPAEKFLSEIAWREFSYHLLYHRKDISRTPMQERFEKVAWREDPGRFEAWSQGRTGIPMVDAGMRQLWETGWMHNRVRMLVASLLAKNLLIDWRQGETWFWDTLVDADVANNPASWQWVAGCGADAAPYFRIFNPVTQGHRFDPKGDYVRRWVPEVARLDDKHVHDPSAAPRAALEAADITLGETYPEAILDLKGTRERALEALAR